MSSHITLLSVVGARPQFVKLAPIARAIERCKGAQHCIVHTGQHYDDNMSAAFFAQLEIPKPDLDLGVGSGSHGEQTAAMLTRLEKHFTEAAPDVVLTYGDTNSTLAATLAASKNHVPVAHIEAGLRSFNRLMPEEINRLVADHCSDRLYAPTPQAMENLQKENLLDRAVRSGDVMLDAVMRNIELAGTRSSVLRELGLKPQEFGLVTVHRPANTSVTALPRLLRALEEVARRYVPLLFPVHPRTQAVLKELGYKPPRELRLLEPVSYLDNISLIQSAALVITDSGGVQKEAAFLGTPCLTMRDETEWTETVSMGINRLVGYEGKDLVMGAAEVMSQSKVFTADVQRDIERHYGNGTAAHRIIEDCMTWISNKSTYSERKAAS